MRFVAPEPGRYYGFVPAGFLKPEMRSLPAAAYEMEVHDVDATHILYSSWVTLPGHERQMSKDCRCAERAAFDEEVAGGHLVPEILQDVSRG